MPNVTYFDSSVNPAIAVWEGPLGLPEFNKIADADLEAALATAFPAHLVEMDAIADNSAVPSFENTIVALEKSGELLDRAAGIFWNLTGSNTNKVLQALERKLSPRIFTALFSDHDESGAVRAYQCALSDAGWSRP